MNESDPPPIGAATAAGLDPQLERRTLELKGKEALTEVVTFIVGTGDQQGQAKD
jgi:hypothetical protein